MRLNEFSAKTFVANILNCDNRITRCHVYNDPKYMDSQPIIAGTFRYSEKDFYFFTYFKQAEFNTIVVKELMSRTIEIYESFCNGDFVYNEDRFYELCFAKSFIFSNGLFPGRQLDFFSDLNNIIKSNEVNSSLFDKILNIELNYDRLSYKAELLA